MLRRLIPMITTTLIAVQTIVSEIILSDDDHDDDDDDEEIAAALIVTLNSKEDNSIPVRVPGYVTFITPLLRDETFREHFRMSRTCFEDLRNRIGPFLENNAETGRPCMNRDAQLLSTLWLLATLDSFRSVGDRFDMGKSSLSATFVRVVNALNSIAPSIIKWPTDVEAKAEEFARGRRLRNCVGVIDGTFIKIKAPKIHPEIYVTRKSYHAMTLQALCTADMMFTDCYIAYPGSVNDARVFRNSPLFLAVNENRHRLFPRNQYIIGDKAYPLLDWCITRFDYHANPDPEEVYFNGILGSMRSVIERAFALFFGRFRRFKSLDMNRVAWVPATVIAACVLHNICLENDDGDIREFLRVGEEHMNAVEDDELAVDNRYNRQAGYNRRNELLEELF